MEVVDEKIYKLIYREKYGLVYTLYYPLRILVIKLFETKAYLSFIRPRLGQEGE